MIRYSVPGFVVLCIGLAEAGEPGEKAKQALLDLNRGFREAHAAARKLDLDTGGPIILLQGDELILVRGGKETAVNVFPPEYDTLKVFAHMPVAIYLMLGPQGAGALDDKRLEQLRGYREKMTNVAKNIDGIGLDAEALARQKKLLAASQRFLDEVIEQRKFTTDELYAFTRGSADMIKANLAGAAKVQIDSLHKQVMRWKKEIPAQEWQTLRVVVKGAVLAREGNLAKQYFERLLHVKGEGLRLVYMESYYPPTPMLTLLTTLAVDRGIGIAIFDDPQRMFRDVLADAAAAYLKDMSFD
jgi:hypothetical protein